MPEFFFPIYLPGRELLVSRFAEWPEIWYGSYLNFVEAKALGKSIEQQIGYRLPSRAVNNRFLYQGDLEMRVERFRIGTLLFERTKAPSGRNIYCRIVFSDVPQEVMVNMDYRGECTWNQDGTWQLDENVFSLFKSMLKNFEEAYRLGIYMAER